jgi:hypothetical protein
MLITLRDSSEAWISFEGWVFDWLASGRTGELPLSSEQPMARIMAAKVRISHALKMNLFIYNLLAALNA